jgi:hypothetical protein
MAMGKLSSCYVLLLLLGGLVSWVEELYTGLISFGLVVVDGIVRWVEKMKRLMTAEGL